MAEEREPYEDFVDGNKKVGFFFFLNDVFARNFWN